MEGPGHGLQLPSIGELKSWTSWSNVTEFLRDGASGVVGTPFASAEADGIGLVKLSAWINVPLVLLFIMREWFCPPTTAPAAPAKAARSAPNMIGRAVAGSVFSALQRTDSTNEALALSFADVEVSYEKAGRSKELRYAPPDTSALLEQCRRGQGLI